MQTLLGKRTRFCDGLDRRAFMKIGSLGMAGMSLADLTRADNADQRLTTIGFNAGCVSSYRYQRHRKKLAELERSIAFAKSVNATPDELADYGFKVNKDGVRRSALDLLAYPKMSVAKLANIWPELKSIGPEIAEQLEIKGKYSGYMKRQENDIRAFR